MCISRLQPKTEGDVLKKTLIICGVLVAIALTPLFFSCKETKFLESFRLWVAVNTILYDRIQNNVGCEDSGCCKLLVEDTPLAMSVYDGTSNTLKSISGDLKFENNSIKVGERIVCVVDKSTLNLVSVYSSSLKQTTEPYMIYEVIYYIGFKDFNEYTLCEILKNKRRKGENEIMLVNASTHLADLVSEKMSTIAINVLED